MLRAHSTLTITVKRVEEVEGDLIIEVVGVKVAVVVGEVGEVVIGEEREKPLLDKERKIKKHGF